MLALCALFLLVLPVSAQGAPSRKKAIWGPASVNGRSQFPIYRDLGVLPSVRASAEAYPVVRRDRALGRRAAIAGFRGDAPQNDDITAVAVRAL